MTPPCLCSVPTPWEDRRDDGPFRDEHGAIAGYQRTCPWCFASTTVTPEELDAMIIMPPSSMRPGLARARMRRRERVLPQKKTRRMG